MTKTHTNLTPAQARALEVLNCFTGGQATVKDLHANYVRLDVVRRLCLAGLAYCARDNGDDTTAFALSSTGRD